MQKALKAGAEPAELLQRLQVELNRTAAAAPQPAAGSSLPEYARPPVTVTPASLAHCRIEKQPLIPPHAQRATFTHICII